MQDVVAVADVRKRDLPQVAELLLQGEVIGQGLAGMLDLAQGIDHRNAGMLRHAFDSFVRKRAQHDSADPALQIMRDVAQTLARIKPLLSSDR